jgi:hypothetical protein
MTWYEQTIEALKHAGMTFEDNPFFRVVDLLNDQGITDWRDRADCLWVARQEYELRRTQGELQ